MTFMVRNIELAPLLSLGFSENEARVYLAALSLGPTSVLSIAKKSGMHRTTVYAVVESLKKQGYIHEQTEGFKTKFVAEDPEKLEEILEKRREEFKKALPELSSLFHTHGSESSMKFYEGLSAVKRMYRELLKELDYKDEWFAISNTKRWYEVDLPFFQWVTEQRAKKKLDVRLILQDSEKTQELVQYQKNYSMQIRTIPEHKNFKMSLLVTPKHLVMHNLLEPTSAIYIQNQVAIDMQRQVFDLMWQSLPEEQK